MKPQVPRVHAGREVLARDKRIKVASYKAGLLAGALLLDLLRQLI